MEGLKSATSLDVAVSHTGDFRAIQTFTVLIKNGVMACSGTASCLSPLIIGSFSDDSFFRRYYLLACSSRGIL